MYYQVLSRAVPGKISRGKSRGDTEINTTKQQVQQTLPSKIIPQTYAAHHDKMANNYDNCASPVIISGR